MIIACPPSVFSSRHQAAIRSRQHKAVPMASSVSCRLERSCLGKALMCWSLPELPWRLTIVGDRTRDRQAAAALDADIARHRFNDRVTILGEVSPHQLAKLYGAADVFVLASRFEGYGMAYAEAIASGLPVIGTNAGAIPETVPPGAGILVRPNDASALAEALRRIIEDPGERLRLGSAARAAAAHLPTWQASAKVFARAIETVE